MIYIEAPKLWVPTVHRLSVFLAGGISGCPNWQAELCEQLDLEDMVVLNPRRPVPKEWIDPVQQIRWEAAYLHFADTIIFWFPQESDCPITLYELGRWIGPKVAVVGIHPGYRRRIDVETQVKIAAPHVPIVHAVGDVARRLRGLYWGGV